MLPIMDRLAKFVKNNEDIEMSVTYDAHCIESEQANKILKVLSDLGCRTSLGESYEDIVKSRDSQEKNEENQECHATQAESKKYILQLFNPGPSKLAKLETVKTIKESLFLGLKEAKDLVDSCPVSINLREHQIKESEYEALLDLLKRKGCTCNLI